MSDESETSRARPGPLAGIRVIDMTSVVLGPYATQTLGDMGADVIKVEGPEGDIIRYAEPARSRGMGAMFLNMNRNKRSVVLDLKKTGARAALLRLVRGADVFMHSMRPAAIGRLGLTYADLRAERGDLVYCSAWGFGSGGPYAERPAYDDIIQGMSGVADLFARRSGGAPELAPTIIADKVSGLTAVGAIAMALFHRQRSGEGQEIEVPMFETLAAFTLLEHFAGAAFEPPLGPIGYRRSMSPERKPYRTRDGWMTVLPYARHHWQAFFTAAGRPQMVADVRVTDAVERSRHVEDLYRMVAEIMPARTTAEWVQILDAADVPSAPVNRLEDVVADPHMQAVGLVESYDHPSEGRLKTTKVTTRFSATPGVAVRRPPPRLGEHTREVLAQAGLDAHEVDELVMAGAAIDAV